MSQASSQAEIGQLTRNARQAMERCDWLEAGRCWEEIRTRDPLRAEAYLGAGSALRHAGRYDDAERVLRAGAERFPRNEQITLALAWLANTRHDFDSALTLWEAARERFPQNPWCYVGNVQALRSLGRSDQIEALLASAEKELSEAKQRGLSSSDALRLHLAIAKARLDWPSVRVFADKIIASNPSPTADVWLAMAQACWHTGERDEADHAAERALRSNAHLIEAVLIRTWVATERGDGEMAVSCYSRLVELNPDTVRWSLKLIQLLTWVGRVNEAVRELEKVCEKWPNDPIVRLFVRNYGPAPAATKDAISAAEPAQGDPDRAEWEELQRIADHALESQKQLRSIVVADPESDAITVEIPSARTAVIVFTGGNDAVSMPLPIFDRFMAVLKVTTVYVKDFKRLRYLLGIASLGSNYEETLLALRKMIGSFGAKRLCTIGNCEGGFAAIRYGVELGAERIVTFGAPTYSPDDSLTKIEQARNFMRNRLAARVSPDMTDLKPFLESRGDSTQIEFFYEEEDPRDRIHAMHIAGLPGIRLHPQPGLNHGMLRRLALAHKNFPDMLRNLLGLESVGLGD